MSKIADLLPCPFCGGTADFSETNAWWVRCNECNAETEADMSPEAAAEIWNRRTPPPQTHLRVTNPATISDFRTTLSDHGVNLPLVEHEVDIGTLVDADGKPVLVVDVDRERSDEDVAWIRGMIQVAVNTCGGFKAQRTATTTEGSTDA